MQGLFGPSLAERVTSAYTPVDHEILSHGPAPRCYRHRRDASAIVSSRGDAGLVGAAREMMQLAHFSFCLRPGRTPKGSGGLERPSNEL